MSLFRKNNVAAFVAELVGTGLLALVVLSVVQVTGGIGYYVSFAVGLALAVLVLTFSTFSGAYLNPAITVGAWTVRKISSARAGLYIVAQLIGGFLAYLLFTYMIGQDIASKTLEFDARILVAEVVGTAILAIGVAATALRQLEGGAKAAIVGGSITVGILIASIASAAYLNPAVALASQSWEWGTYVLGPVLGAVIGFNLYNLLFTASTAPAKAAKAVATPAVAAKPAAKKAAATKKPAAKKAPAKKK